MYECMHKCMFVSCVCVCMRNDNISKKGIAISYHLLASCTYVSVFVCRTYVDNISKKGDELSCIIL